MTFQCSKCGACCRRAGIIPNFPEPTLADGRCIHLLPDGTCSIYERRPDVCRVARHFDLLIRGGLIENNRAKFYALNAAACNEMIRADGLPKKFLLDETFYQEGK